MHNLYKERNSPPRDAPYMVQKPRIKKMNLDGGYSTQESLATNPNQTAGKEVFTK